MKILNYLFWTALVVLNYWGLEQSEYKNPIIFVALVISIIYLNKTINKLNEGI